MGSFVSRRVSEFVGVALFALALMWLISLASYTPADPVWFFTTGADGATPLNFGGRVGAFLAELSYQMLGYSAYLLPIVLVVSGWHYFWCRTPDAAYTKLVGAAAALRLCLVIPVTGVWHSAASPTGRSSPEAISAAAWRRCCRRI